MVLTIWSRSLVLLFPLLNTPTLSGRRNHRLVDPGRRPICAAFDFIPYHRFFSTPAAEEKEIQPRESIARAHAKPMVLVTASCLGGSRGVVCAAEHCLNQNDRHLVTVHVSGWLYGRTLCRRHWVTSLRFVQSPAHLGSVCRNVEESISMPVDCDMPGPVGRRAWGRPD